MSEENLEMVEFQGTGFSVLEACMVSGIDFHFWNNTFIFINDNKYSDEQRKMFWNHLKKIGAGKEPIISKDLNNLVQKMLKLREKTRESYTFEDFIKILKHFFNITEEDLEEEE